MPSAMIEPTDRSMPAVTITTYMPSASGAGEAFCLRILVRFCGVRKTSGRIAASTSIITTTTMMIPQTSRNFERFGFENPLPALVSLIAPPPPPPPLRGR